jgi:hypothetical protein
VSALELPLLGPNVPPEPASAPPLSPLPAVGARVAGELVVAFAFLLLLQAAAGNDANNNNNFSQERFAAFEL